MILPQAQKRRASLIGYKTRLFTHRDRRQHRDDWLQDFVEISAVPHFAGLKLVAIGDKSDEESKLKEPKARAV